MGQGRGHTWPWTESLVGVEEEGLPGWGQVSVCAVVPNYVQTTKPVEDSRVDKCVKMNYNLLARP